MMRSTPIKKQPPTKGKAIFSCFKILSIMISVQLFFVFLVALNMGGRFGAGGIGISILHHHQIHTTSSISSVEDAESQEKRDQMIEELDRLDPRQDRVLYSHNDSQTQQREEDQPQQSSLDNYGSRRHFLDHSHSPYEASEDSTDDAPYLIVGGSDGSGTRAMVDALISLGVFFHVEDRRTMDIHGVEMFRRKGWPPLVEIALRYTHSANYNVSDLPPEARQVALTELNLLKRGIDRKVRKRIIHLDKKDSKTKKVYAGATKLGWKAPCSMLLMPLLQQVFGRVKYLHVVRDGRDIAISDNQSPVKKFYNIIYGLPNNAPPADKDINAFSMQLWNDMNRQAMEWGKSHSDGKTFDYLMVRSEDLVNPETKFETLLQLADFVGSRKTMRELCCMSQTELKDMGKSANGFVDPRNKRRRFGRFVGGGNGPLADKADFIMDRLFNRDRGAHLREMREGLDRKRTAHGKPPPRSPHEYGLQAKDGTSERENRRRDETLSRRPQKDTRGLQVAESKDQDQDDERAASKNGESLNKISRRLLDMSEMFAHKMNRRGRHGNPVEKEAPEKVKARYGKWAKFLEDKPDLSQQLHQLGAASLRDFGYEPPAQFLDPPDDSFLQQCQAILSYNLCREADGKMSDEARDSSMTISGQRPRYSHSTNKTYGHHK